MDPDAVEARVRAFLSKQLNLRDAPIERDTELVTTGLLDSMDVVRLVAHLERTLGITIPDGDIDVDHFDSIAKISSYLEARLGS